MKVPVGLQCEELRGSQIPTLWSWSSKDGERETYDDEGDHLGDRIQMLCYVGRREMASVRVCGGRLSTDYEVSRG